jgi:5-methylcytosine-specific restriction endonuclease McrA
VIDLKLFATILTREEPYAEYDGVIQPTDVLTLEAQKFFAECPNKTHIRRLFAKVGGLKQDSKKWFFEATCDFCGTLYVNSSCKEDLLRLIRYGEHSFWVPLSQAFVELRLNWATQDLLSQRGENLGGNGCFCSDCRLKAWQQVVDKELEQIKSALIRRNCLSRTARSVRGKISRAVERCYRRWAETENSAEDSERKPDTVIAQLHYESGVNVESYDIDVFIETFLSVNALDGNQEKPVPFFALEDAYQQLTRFGAYEDQRAQVARAILKMPYGDFLKTRYWRSIAAHVRHEHKHNCVMCPVRGFHIHHRTYDHHGYEIEYWDTDLTCLCEGCHKKFHHEPN